MSSISNELVLSSSKSLETKDSIWSSAQDSNWSSRDRMYVNELVSISSVAVIGGMWD